MNLVDIAKEVDWLHKFFYLKREKIIRVIGMENHVLPQKKLEDLYN